MSEVGERRVGLCDSAQPWAIPPACRSSEVPGPACSIDAATLWGEFGELRLDGAEAVSIHVYGTDVTRIGSSVRRFYD